MEITPENATTWLVEKIAVRTETDPKAIDINQYFDEFDLDSAEALVLAGELQEWLGFEIPATSLWYYPTIEALGTYVAEEATSHADS